MKYMLLIFGEAAPDELNEETWPRWEAFNEELRSRNAYVHASALQRASSATTLRLRGGEPLLTDGPFVETKEQLAGYYVIDCADLDEAIDLASRIPSAQRSAIEIRPVLE